MALWKISHVFRKIPLTFTSYRITVLVATQTSAQKLKICILSCEEDVRRIEKDKFSCRHNGRIFTSKHAQNGNKNITFT